MTREYPHELIELLFPAEFGTKNDLVAVPPPNFVATPLWRSTSNEDRKRLDAMVLIAVQKACPMLTATEWGALSDAERRPYCDEAVKHLRQEQAAKLLRLDPTKVETPNDADFRYGGPNGPLLTPKEIRTRYGISGSALSKEAKKLEEKRPPEVVRIKNPGGGSGYVYRYDFVSLLSNRRADPDE